MSADSCRTGEVAHDDTGDIDGLMIAGGFGGVVGGPITDLSHATPCISAFGDVLNSAGSDVAHRLTKRHLKP